MGCRMLRWKAWYGHETSEEDALREAAARNDTPFWCLRTCQPFGPDDGPCAPESCGSHRACFTPRRGANT